MAENEVVKVSVCICTYNQEHLIKTCLDSIISQKTRFNFEIIIGDDASTDNTLKVIREYELQHPGLIRVVAHEKNVGATQNLQVVHQLAKGMYVAHCDGDDYFLPGKLQIQADYLDNNQDVVQTWHRMKLVDGNNKVIGNLPRRFPWFMHKKLPMKKLALAYFMIGFHSSLMYRKSAKSVYDRTNFTIDYFYALDVGSKGKSVHLNQYLGCYRTVPGTSLTTSTASIQKVDTAVAEAADYFSELYPELTSSFYGNLWFKRKLIRYAGYETSEEYERVFRKLKKKASLYYGLKSTVLYVILYSSLSPRILKRWFSKPGT